MKKFILLIAVSISHFAVFAQGSFNLRAMAFDAFYKDATPVATIFFKAVLLNNPDDLIARLYLEASLLTEGKTEEALNFKQNGITDHSFTSYSDSVKVVYYYTQLMFSAYDSDFSKAADYAQKMIEIDPSDMWALETHASLYEELGLYSKSIDDYSCLLQLSSDTPKKQYNYYYKRGRCYQDSGLYTNAINDFSSMLEIIPHDGNALYRRGWCFEFLKDDVRALRDYNEGLEYAEDEIGLQWLYLMRGELFNRAGEHEKAKADFERIVQIDTTLNNSCRHYALCFLGMEEEALQWMDNIIQQSPDDAGNYYDKCCLLTWMKRYEEALDALRECIRLGYKKIQQIKNDDDLDPLRQFERYNDIIRVLEDEALQS